MSTFTAQKWAHYLYQSILVLIVLAVTLYLAIEGYDYYRTPLEERFYHEEHQWFKASGLFGHGLGIIGTLMIAVGVFLYIPAKKYGFLERFIRLRYLLEFHIFLCTLGPILILFHTTFKFGGVVSVAFWAMVLVVLSGVIGRYLYLQIPRSISGHELSRQEIKKTREALRAELAPLAQHDPQLLAQIEDYQNPEQSWWARRRHYRQTFKSIQARLGTTDMERGQMKQSLAVLKRQMTLQQRIAGLERMQRLFKYWHVAHRPFALIMLLVLIVHVVVTVGMGYKWIF